MQERERDLPEELSTPVHVEVRWHRKDPDTSSTQPVPHKTVHLARLNGVVLGTSYDTLEVFSAKDADSLQKELGTKQALDTIKGRYIGLAWVDEKAKLTMEIYGGEHQTVELTEEKKTGIVHLENDEALLIGAVGVNQNDVKEAFEALFTQERSQS